MTVLSDKNEHRIFGAEQVNKTKPFYVVEGPIDSFFLDNSVAVCGSDLGIVDHPNAIFILDCEPRNQQIVNKVKKLIDRGSKVCLLPPEEYYGMDLNDIVKNDPGINLEELINNHIVSGAMTALVHFNRWRKV